MSYATVMVHVDVAGEMGAHVKVAAALADRFRARLIGISGWAPTSVFLAEEALQDPIPSTPPLQEMEIHTGHQSAAIRGGIPHRQPTSGMAIRSRFSVRLHTA